VGAWMVGKVWLKYEEPKEEVEKPQDNEVLERKINYKTVVVTEVTPEMHFYAQNTETGELLSSMFKYSLEQVWPMWAEANIRNTTTAMKHTWRGRSRALHTIPI